MDTLGLSQKDFSEVIRVCHREPVNESTPVAELKQFLVARLQEEFPDTAHRIERFSDGQMEELRREVEQTFQAGVGSFLW
jgi:hypothetical protein